ncbi:metal ABC transporter ATP-binding protein [Gulosibacter sp. GYB002]|uniref:metal ABC transporter ATP-binding protein n=1 Tax=Gulosibacter sp. GYB002 TaxID=2994391 RepID=UPI002F96D750
MTHTSNERHIPETSSQVRGCAVPPTAQSAQSPVVEFRSANLSYDGSAVAAAGVTLTVRPGEAVALIGPNGAGKSTVLKALLGLVSVIDGELRVFGGNLDRASNRIGYLPQRADLDANFPVSLRQVVMMGRYRELGIFRWPGKTDQQAVDAALERVRLTDRADRVFGDLSGGQQQRGLLARALVSNPKLLLLDEPFNGLDTTNRTALLETLRELRGEEMAIMVATHDLEIATQACTHALLINHQQVAFGPVAQVLTDASVVTTFGESTDHRETHSDAIAHPHPIPHTSTSEPLP